MPLPVPDPRLDDVPQTRTPAALPPMSRSPIHLLSALVTVSVDKLWERMLLDMVKTMPLQDKERFLLYVGLLLLIATMLSITLTQYMVDNDTLGIAFAKGLALGVLAGLPYSFSSTEMGLFFIGWSGINELQKQQKEARQKQQDHEQGPQRSTTTS
ncbi:hypothetical protein [Paraburkholderia sp. SOS3]|jgi:hypothetical protein|uniref:hypothetical protein n=1 Tax=Paraburkholderia sp. SOS3 TaxID=1926494 RepID=UPI0009476F9C|nr:hypothetical protein [Paraburkholderia sp. SOS3]APR37949.1 hypothetical protein BTO02_20570 [Paraburkholderia sp. SOS3]